MSTFVLYSNKAYEYMVESFLASRSYAATDGHTVAFYTIGYDSDIEYPNLVKRRWDPPIERQNFQFYKPHIMRLSLEFEGDLIYFDTDILLGCRFDPVSLSNSRDYPMACLGPLEHVYYWETDQHGNVHRYTEEGLMQYFGVGERTTGYVWTSMLSYSRACSDFIDEWCSMVDNTYLNGPHNSKHNFPFGDETAFNVLLWKRGCTDILGRVFLNTIKFETMKMVETSDSLYLYKENELGDHPDPSVYEKCDSSSEVQFYHGIKERGEIHSAICWMVCSK